MKNNNLFITEISEEDFRKLNLEGQIIDSISANFSRTIALNTVLDSVIDRFTKYDPEALDVPVTIAIFKDSSIYEKNFRIVAGLNHVYSTRDYFTAKDGVWKVKKRYLKAIYRIHLDK